MNDERFLELVNLYIDRQASPAEQDELSQALAHDAKRRRIYLGYCRMHRATLLVGEKFRPTAPTAQTPQAFEKLQLIKRSASTQNRHQIRQGVLVGLSAAACLAFSFMLLNRTEDTMSDRPIEGVASTSATTISPLAEKIAQNTPEVLIANSAHTPVANNRMSSYSPAIASMDASGPVAAQDTRALLSEQDYANLLALARQQGEVIYSNPVEKALVGAIPPGADTSELVIPTNYLSATPTTDSRLNPQTELTTYQFRR